MKEILEIKEKVEMVGIWERKESMELEEKWGKRERWSVGTRCVTYASKLSKKIC